MKTKQAMRHYMVGNGIPLVSFCALLLKYTDDTATQHLKSVDCPECLELIGKDRPVDSY